MSALLVISNGECIESMDTPQSTTSAPRFATHFAIVPPPPRSTFPNSAVCQGISFLLKSDLNREMN